MLALMRFLTSVSTNVDGQRASLDEALAAARRTASIGTLIGVYPVMSLQV